MKFGTLVNCTDGRVQYPVMDYLKKKYDFDFFDAANEAGPLRTLTKNSDKCRLITLKEQIRTSLEEHDSKFIALVGHHDCTDNPGDRAFQENQMDAALGAGLIHMNYEKTRGIDRRWYERRKRT